MSEKLTVAKLIEDLQKIDANSEVCLVIEGIGMTVPISGLMHLETHEEPIALISMQKGNVELALGLHPGSQEIN